MEMNINVIGYLRQEAEQELEQEINKMESSVLHDLLEKVLREYPRATPAKRIDHTIVVDVIEKQIPGKLADLNFFRFNSYKIKGSAGRPNMAVLPWVAILDTRITDTTMQGYYICYLFSKDRIHLTLKHSDQPVKDFKADGRAHLKVIVKNLRNKLHLEGFEKTDLVDEDEKYSESDYRNWVIAHKSYDKGAVPEEQQIKRDLFELVTAYKELVDQEVGVADRPQSQQLQKIEDKNVMKTLSNIKQYIKQQGFSYPDLLIENFYLSLKSKPFVILAGISGTGKTKLVKLFAEAVGATRDNAQFELIPVRPDWSDPSDLIGYRDIAGEFVKGRLTEVLERASNPENQAKTYFICLDEMNLARVEHYFSDLLSLMETQEWVEDENDTKRITTGKVVTLKCEEGDVDLCIPENVYIIGTVNMDETTHPFSKKVLDRANTIEFNHIELMDLYDNTTGIEGDAEVCQVHQSFLRSDYLNIKDAQEYHPYLKASVERLAKVNKILEQINAHVGYRIRDAICFYLTYNKRFGLLDESDAFDIQLCQKILPRIQGSSQSVRNTLVELLNFTTKDVRKYKADHLMEEDSELYNLVFGTDETRFDSFAYKQSSQKIAFMLRRLEEDGFTSFWLA
ncbi:dynein-related subfamily AAA family protein [Tumebacillus sp. BK434]|nr:dynein-related subfamily AAA family protein [Tumebacillus sp. BK434]